MKRWIVLLIVFALMGGWIVLSGCSGTTEVMDVCVTQCATQCAASVVGYTKSCVESCFATCFDCSWICNIKCTGEPIQDCLDAFTTACNERQNENFQPSNLNNAG